MYCIVLAWDVPSGGAASLRGLELAQALKRCPQIGEVVATESCGRGGSTTAIYPPPDLKSSVPGSAGPRQNRAAQWAGTAAESLHRCVAIGGGAASGGRRRADARRNGASRSRSEPTRMLPERAGPRRAALRRTHCAVAARVQAARLEALLTRAPSEDGCASVLRRAARDGVVEAAFPLHDDAALAALWSSPARSPRRAAPAEQRRQRRVQRDSRPGLIVRRAGAASAGMGACSGAGGRDPRVLWRAGCVGQKPSIQ